MELEHSTLKQIQALTRPKLRNIDHTLDDADLAARCPLDSGRHATRRGASAGGLEKLPLELVLKILLPLDLATLTTFRRVNSAVMGLVDSLPEYQAVLKHCPDIVRAILSIGAGSFSFLKLYRTLCTAKCHSCEQFGNFLYLITCRRVCYSCFTTKLDYHPISAVQAMRVTGLPWKEFVHLPHITSLPGRYTPSALLSLGRILLWDRQAVLDMALENCGQPTLIIAGERHVPAQESRRYMVIIPAPCLQPSESEEQGADWGVHCDGCSGRLDLPMHFRNKYTMGSIVDHLRLHGIEVKASKFSMSDMALALPQPMAAANDADSVTQ